MQTSRPSVGYHILALVTILVWGTTFASTKILLMHGLTPPEIMLYRFIIAIALRLDLPSECLKLISATIVALAIGLPAIKAAAKPATAKGGK